MRQGYRHRRMTQRRETADELLVFAALVLAICVLVGAGFFAALALSRLF